MLLAISAPSAAKIYIYCLTEDEPELISVIVDDELNITHAFGYSISLSLDFKNDYILAIGEPFDDDGGSVYIYESKDIGLTWELESEINNPNTDTSTKLCDNFGYSVSIQPDALAIGAPGTKKVGYASYGNNMLSGTNCGIGSGSVYIYEEFVNTTGSNFWAQNTQLFSSLPVSTDWAAGFGFSTDMRQIDGNVVLAIGAPQIGLGNFQYQSTWAQGTVYIYQEEADLFNFKASISSAEAINYDQFGYSVGISAFSSSSTPKLNPVLAIGAINCYTYLSNPNGAKTPGSGAVYIYKQNTQQFTFYKQFETPSDILHPGMQFGAALAVDTGGPIHPMGDYHVVVGAPDQHIEDTVVILDAGSAYVLDVSESDAQSGGGISGASIVVAIIIIIIIILVIIIIIVLIVRNRGFQAQGGFSKPSHIPMDSTNTTDNPYSSN